MRSAFVTIGCRRSSVVEREHKTSETCRPLPRTRSASIKYDRTTIAFLSPSVGFAFKRAHSPAHEHGPRTSVRDFYVLIDGFTTNVAPSPPTPEVVESSPPKISLSGRNFNVTGGPGTPRSLLLFTITPRARPIACVSVRERPLNYYTRSSPNVRRAVDVTTSALYVPFLTPSVNVVENLRTISYARRNVSETVATGSPLCSVSVLLRTRFFLLPEPGRLTVSPTSNVVARTVRTPFGDSIY